MPSVLSTKLCDFPLRSRFLSGFLRTTRQPNNCPYRTLVSPAAFWTDISLFPAWNRAEETQGTAEHPLPSSSIFFQPPSHGSSYPWQTRTVVYMPKKTVFTELAITSGTCSWSRHILQRKNASFQALQSRIKAV